MRVWINLASEPFRNRRAWIVGVGLLVGVCVGGSLLLAARARNVAQQAEALTELVEQQEGEIRRLRQQIPPPVAPEQLSPLEREAWRAAAALIERRVFPWSRLLQDIERSLGADARVTTIRVASEETASVDVLNPGRAPVRVALTLIGRRLDDVLQVMERLRASGRFRDFRPRKQSPLEGTEEVEYELEVTYFPEPRHGGGG
ncbi:MAG: hypothetical protein N0A16_07785 [Blastocatellia bacterium]|nr:hypothetical protein [Blastocatellia bacterium]MCS7157614.1 hypothetical protein [Blastocatellia bacterium]MCX7751879.1 hypothetical protein [Blastocatellia bacterium]MDW8166985.1 hypothetical protein [Acidobacteriota bacterium]MDW8257089.1 hypothetical protein [Acidobacteriota bacterium]